MLAGKRGGRQWLRARLNRFSYREWTRWLLVTEVLRVVTLGQVCNRLNHVFSNPPLGAVLYREVDNFLSIIGIPQ